MVLVGAMYYTLDYKRGGRITRWGKIVSVNNETETAKVYWPNNPKDYKYSKIPVRDIEKWVEEKLIFLKN